MYSLRGLATETRPFALQAYAYVISCLVYRDPNTAIAAMETLHQLLVSATAELSIWLCSPLVTTRAAADFWSESGDAASDTTSLVSEVGEGGREGGREGGN